MKAVSKAGRSEKSYFIKGGIRKGKEISKNGSCKTTDIADIIPQRVSESKYFLFFINITEKIKKLSPDK